MSERRTEGSPCPINEQPLSMGTCRPCVYFRGAVAAPDRVWRIACNWPRNGSTDARAPIPVAFTEGMS